jgi:8-oxo-dGTP diphosphatase
MTNYVVGFAFTINRRAVWLIEKQKPAFMVGLWNGIGGKVEDAEIPHEAMIREGLEEAGVELDWDYYACLNVPEFGQVYCFKAFTDEQLFQCEKEVICQFDLKILPNVWPNLHWLLPLALDNEVIVSEIFYREKNRCSQS